MFKLLVLFVLIFLGLEGTDFLLHAFNCPSFPGEAYGALAAMIVWLFYIARTSIRVMLYKPRPKPKEGPKQ
jgi:hypothetical protein